MERAFSAVLPFLHVRKLTVTMSFYFMPQNIAIFSKFPSVRVLKLDAWQGKQDAIAILPSSERPSVPASDVLPLLEEYICNCDPLHLFLGRPALTRLVISYGCTPAQLVQQYGTYTFSVATDMLDAQKLTTL
ncbi:hypothetical protein FB45DRAFT_1021514 [Roridomyces roridus]|uniref:Uncharacterized protein n=1 Tax=Roridomyces roridus TaxID=1738132 RepID=A0AAD7CEE1_9AGAR|nr:hypothetical protein FB45DRAFT_1021514 [Roridomyces roridus]